MINVVFIIPTGIGCEIGGHAGDASPSANLVASVCDKLIVHPNVYNASDINEMANNVLYVEGSILNRFLEGKIELQEVKSNKILVVTNSPLKNEVINSVSAGRVTIGIDASVLVLKTPLRMIGRIEGNKATGDVIGYKELIEQVTNYDFDALAITTMIEVSKDTELNYFRYGGINPWGGVEAKASKLIANELNKPVAHSPIAFDIGDERLAFREVIDPRMSAEMVSVSYLHCILKGLHKAPRIGKGLSVKDVDCLITPIGCVGDPHLACLNANIPIIAVEENGTCLNDKMPKEFIIVKNYIEAVGMIKLLECGMTKESVTRPINYTKIKGDNYDNEL